MSPVAMGHGTKSLLQPAARGHEPKGLTPRNSPAAPSVSHTPRLRALVHFGRRPIRRGDGLVIAGIRSIRCAMGPRPLFTSQKSASCAEFTSTNWESSRVRRQCATPELIGSIIAYGGDIKDGWEKTNDWLPCDGRALDTTGTFKA
jgi:hypothetical protein